MMVQSIGKTAEGRDQLMAIITAPENFKRLDRYQEIARRLSQAEGLTDDQARALAKEGKAVVWIDGGLHATEVLGAQQLIETIYQFASKTDEETLRILRDVIILAAHANPDGMELVSDWYMRKPDPKQRSTSGTPAALSEVRRARQQPRLLHDEPAGVGEHQPDALPRVVPADRLQPSPDRADRHGDVLAAVPRSVQLRLRPAGRQHARPGRRRHARALRRRRASPASRRGPARTTPRGGTAACGRCRTSTTRWGCSPRASATRRRSRSASCRIACCRAAICPSPIPPQTWHFRQSIDYSITANYAVLDFAQRYRETLLFNIYVMGRNSIRKGGTDTWTMYPKRIAAVKAEIAKEMQTEASDARMVSAGARRPVPAKYYELLQQAGVARSAHLRDPRRQGRLPHRDQVREHHDPRRPHGAPRDRAGHRRRQDLSRPGRTSFKAAQAVPAAPDRHVRAAGSPERLPVPGRPADSAVRHHRLDAGLSDGTGASIGCSRTSPARSRRSPTW